MATNTISGALTFAQIQKALGPDSKLQTLYDPFRRRSTIFDDLVWVRANFPDKHRMFIRDGTGNPSFVGQNDFASISNIPPRNEDAFLGMLEEYSQVDDRWEELYPEIIQYRNEADADKMGDMGAAFATTVFYGSRAADPKSFDGLATKANVLNNPAGTYTFDNPICIDAGGSANRTSIYFVQHDKSKVFGIYGHGGNTGIDVKDLGRQPVYNATGLNSGVLFAYMSRIRFNGGIAVQDQRGIARIANIDATNSDPWTNYTLQDKINTLRAWMNPTGLVSAYCSPTIFAKTQTFLQNKANVWYKVDEFGKEYFDWMGFRWRVAEQINSSETAVA